MAGALTGFGSTTGSSAINPALEQSSRSSLRHVSVIGTAKQMQEDSKSQCERRLLKQQLHLQDLQQQGTKPTTLREAVRFFAIAPPASASYSLF